MDEVVSVEPVKEVVVQNAPKQEMGFHNPKHPWYRRQHKLYQITKAAKAKVLKKQKEKLRGERAELNHRIAKALRSGVERLSEVEWQELKGGVLLRAMTEPSVHGGVSLKAIELIESERERMKFGNRESLERTLARCKERMREIRGIESAVRNGSDGGTGGEARTIGKDCTGTE